MLSDLLSSLWDLLMAYRWVRRTFFVAILAAMYASFGLSWELFGIWALVFAAQEAAAWLQGA
jgi:hypothetical protein